MIDVCAEKIIIEQANWHNDQTKLITVRTRVFVQEQRVPADLEIDGMDAISLHVKAITPNGNVVGTARLLPSHYIGRMCVLNDYRKAGIGTRMLSFFIDYARQNKFDSLMLNAQITALHFYQQLGFIADSDVFIEADIEHVHMTLSLAN